MNKKRFYFLTAILLFMYSGFLEAQNVQAFSDIPGLTESNKYRCRVKKSSDSAWQKAFVTQTESLLNPIEYPIGDSRIAGMQRIDNGFHKDLAGWTSSHIAFESPVGSTVEVEVSLVNGATINKVGLINKVTVRPANEATYIISADKKTVIVTFNKHTNIYLDINGQMEDQYTGDGYADNLNNDKIHTLCIFSNPIYSKPVQNIISVPPSNDPNSYRNLNRSSWDAMIFEPGLHNIGTQFPIQSGETYFIPGDAIVYGTFLPNAGASNIEVSGSGAICGSKTKWGGVGATVNNEDVRGSDAVENKVFTNNVTNARFKGFVVLDPTNHTFNMGNSSTATNVYENLKILGWRVNGDGFNVFENSTVKNCFVRTQDDCFYLGNNVQIENNVTWTDANGAVMYLARTAQGNSTFKGTKCIYTRRTTHSSDKGVIELRDTDNDILQATIEDLEVQDPRPTFGLFKMTVKDPNKNFNNINFINCRMNGTRQDGRKMQMIGLSSSMWKNITFTNCSYQGTCLSSLTSTLWDTSNVETATIKFNCGTTNTPVTSVSVSPTTLSIANGGTSQLTATVSPSNATNKNVTWSSSNAAVATVSSTGLVSATGAGTAVITVTTTDGNKTATSTITVTTASQAVTGVTIDNCPSAGVPVNGTVDLASTVLPLNASNQGITWTSSNPAVATIDPISGLVTAKAVGTAVMTVKTSEGNFTATCTISVIAAPACSLPWTKADFTITNTSNSYTSNAIDISCASSVTISMDLSETDFFEAADKLTVSYKLNGGAAVLIKELINDFTSFAVNVPNLSGNTLEILINGVTDDAAEIYYIKNLKVTATTTAPATNVVELTPWVSGTTNNRVSGTNRLMVVMVMGEHSADFSAATVTYGTQVMTKQAERMYAEGTSSRTYASIYTLNEAGVNAATSGAISVSYNGIANGGSPSGGSSIYSVLLGNVNQTTPVIGAVANSLSGTSITTTALSSSSGDLLLYGGATAANTDASPNNGFTETFESNTTWGDGVGGSKLSTGVSEIPQFSQSASGRMVICALVVKKSSGSPAARIGQSQATLSVEENLQAGTTLKLYPNPVSSILTIESDSNSEKEISVINTLGQVVYRTKSKSPNTQIDMQSLNVSGLVLVQVIEEGKVSTHKVIVK